MVTITIQGYGQFQISVEKLQELLNWLARNNGVKVQVENQTSIFHGKTLING